MLLLIPIIFLAIVLFYLISMTMTTNKGCRRRRRKQKECFVEYNEPTATGQIMLTDGVGNLSTFNVGTGKTLVSDGAGNITTINTGLFNNTITANNGISGTSGTFSGQLEANGGLTANGGFTGSTGTFTGQLRANGGLTGTTGTFTSILNANGGISGSTATLTGNLSVGGVSSNLNFTQPKPQITANGSAGPLVIDPNFTSDNYLLLYDRVDVDGVLNAKGNLNVAGEYTANGIVSVKSGLNIVNRKSGLPMTHFDYFGDGANYISGNTNFRNGSVTIDGAITTGGKSVAKIPTTNGEAQNGMTEISNTNEGAYGDWGNWTMCPAGSYVCGFVSKVEAPVSGDDTSMNAVRLRCCKFLT